MTETDGAAVRIPPPLVYLAALLIGPFLLQRFVWPLAFPLPRGAAYALGVAVAIAGILVIAAAVRLFRRTEQEPEPWKPTPEIIDEGIYRRTRNPMYVGMGLVQLGFGIAVRSAWIVLLLPAVLGIVYLIAVRHEEAYLEDKFGDEYRRYKEAVRRWV